MSDPGAQHEASMRMAREPGSSPSRWNRAVWLRLALALVPVAVFVLLLLLLG